MRANFRLHKGNILATWGKYSIHGVADSDGKYAYVLARRGAIQYVSTDLSAVCKAAEHLTCE